jgi:hypothetical protein
MNALASWAVLRHLTRQLGTEVGQLRAIQDHLVEIRNTLRDLPDDLGSRPSRG